ncbi:fluoride efflux transporter CrcB [soil metagenome]
MWAQAGLVALGGAAGSMARFGAVMLVKPHAPEFPAGTLSVNLLGSLLIGVLAGCLHASALGRSSPLWLLLAVGVLGGFTTFSSLALETVELLNAQRWGAAAAYIGASVVLGLVLAAGGFALGRAVMAG